MRRVTRAGRAPARRATVALAVTAGLLMTIVIPSGALAFGNGDGDSRGGGGGGGLDGGRLTADVHASEIVITGDRKGDGGGGLEPLSGDWTPPVCWYEPWMTAEEFADAVEEMESSGGRGHRALNINSPAVAFTDIYRDNDPAGWAINTGSRYGDVGYEDYNRDADEDGLWWRGVINPHRADDYRPGTDCVEPIFWGDPVNPPEVEETITDEILAEYAYDEIGIPDTEVVLNPTGAQLVNLATWIWVDGVDLEPRTVRAELPGRGVWAETTAVPVSLTLDPGTSDADLFPADGVCPVVDGSAGEEWESGRSGEDPPCGVLYRRSTHVAGSYELRATLTWEVTWTGSHTCSCDRVLPDGRFETAVEVTVQESQAIVR